VRVIADKAYDSDPLRKTFAAAGYRIDRATSLQSKENRRHKTAERCGATGGDGCRTHNAWLGNSGVGLRLRRSLTIYRLLFHIACFMIVLRRVVQ